MEHKSMKNTDIFKDQPVLGEGEEEFFRGVIAHVGTLLTWLKRKPTLDMLKKAALHESQNSKRVQVLDRLLTRIYKMEKAEALTRLLK